MRVESIKPLFHPSVEGIRVVEWKTEVEGKKHYHTSRAYTIHLYSRDGRLQEYTNKRNIDLSV